MGFPDFFRLDGVLISADRHRGRGPEAVGKHRSSILAALEQALDHVEEMRSREGTALNQALVELAQELEQQRSAVAAKRDQVVADLAQAYLERLDKLVEALQAKAGALAGQLPEERLVGEAAVLAEKADIEEEVTRLASHIQEFLRLTQQGRGVGRKLDFLCQEMHREVNTMTNKLVQTSISHHTLQMKQTIERLRQQVQNIE